MEENYQFQVMMGPGKVAVASIPKDDVKECPCGCSNFNMVYKVAHISNPSGLVGAPPLWVKVEVFTCTACGYELSLNHLTMKQAAEARKNKKWATL